jgi:hypothetical protein
MSDDLREARRYLSVASESELKNFAARQLRSRQRLSELIGFYSKNQCRMARLHLLASCAITLGRFAGFSETFDQMGEYFMPVNAENQPRTDEWRDFAEACRKKMPLEVREEKWLAAHFADLQNVRENGLYRRFEMEAEQYKDEPTWQLLQQHMEISLGVRLMDKFAISGLVPYETAIADSLVLTTKKLVTAGSRLLGRYAKEAALASFDFSQKTPLGLLSYRRTAFKMVKFTFAALSVTKLFRRGVRERERGRTANETENWNLLPQTLGERINEIHESIIDFYANPAKFDVTATLKLETLPARFWSRVLTLLFGQGLYETDLNEIPARFRVFSRKDGSMHFVRELYCQDKLRVFDSDFVVREGKLFEVFTDLKMAVEMHVEPTESGGLRIRGENIFAHNFKMPSIGLQVEFQSQVDEVDGIEVLKINGHLRMKPRTKTGKFLAYKIMRRPQDLASIHYIARRKSV